MFFFWQVGLVDTLSLIQFTLNTGSQYAVILTRGGRNYNITKSIASSSLEEFAVVVNSVKTPVLDIHPYRTEFTYNNKMIIDNLFQEHTARRYLQRSAQKIKTVAPRILKVSENISISVMIFK